MEHLVDVYRRIRRRQAAGSFRMDSISEGEMELLWTTVIAGRPWFVHKSLHCAHRRKTEQHETTNNETTGLRTSRRRAAASSGGRRGTRATSTCSATASRTPSSHTRFSTAFPKATPLRKQVCPKGHKIALDHMITTGSRRMSGAARRANPSGTSSTRRLRSSRRTSVLTSYAKAAPQRHCGLTILSREHARRRVLRAAPPKGCCKRSRSLQSAETRRPGAEDPDRALRAARLRRGDHVAYAAGGAVAGREARATRSRRGGNWTLGAARGAGRGVVTARAHRAGRAARRRERAGSARRAVG